MGDESKSGIYKLTYFDIRARAEPIRILLALAKLPYEDVRLKFEDWKDMKGKTPWGQLPTLEVEDGKTIAQAMSILRFLSKKCGLYNDDPYQAARIDEFAYAIGELITEWFKFAYSKNDNDKGELKNALITTYFPKYFEKFSKIRLEHMGEGEYLMGAQITFPDVLLADLLDAIDTSMGDGIVDQYPVMRALKNSVWELPEIKEYVQNRSS